jgi:hypothetical protein
MRGTSNQGINDLYGNFTTSTLTKSDEGKAVALTGNNEIGLGAAGDALVGKLKRVEGDSTCLVQIGGQMVLDYTGTVNLGRQVVVNGAGGVQQVDDQAVAEGGTANYTINMKARGFISSIDSTNADVEVLL